MERKPRAFITLLVILIALFVVLKNNPKKAQPEKTISEQSISDGTITVEYDKTFGLATNIDQVLVKSYIPPCGDNFNYCFYFVGDNYKGTNFESAGVRIYKRIELSNERLCLDTPPLGFPATVPPEILKSTDTTTSSVFNNIGDAGAGHYANGALYRLYIKNPGACYEFQTRIGQSQFANYPEGSIKEFTSENQDEIRIILEKLIKNISVGGKKNLFSKT